LSAEWCAAELLPTLLGGEKDFTWCRCGFFEIVKAVLFVNQQTCRTHGGGKKGIPKFVGVFCYAVFRILKWPASMTIGLYACLLCLPGQAGEMEEVGDQKGRSSGPRSSVHCLQFGHQSPFKFEFRH